MGKITEKLRDWLGRNPARVMWNIGSWSPKIEGDVTMNLVNQQMMDGLKNGIIRIADETFERKLEHIEKIIKCKGLISPEYIVKSIADVIK